MQEVFWQVNLRIMKLSNVSGIVRSIDPGYFPNLAIILLAIATDITGFIVYPLLFNSTSLIESILWGIRAGISVFLSWAMAREIDPDHNLSALFVAGLTFILIFVFSFQLSGIILLVWILLIIRVLNRTSGKYASILDSLVILGFGVWFTYQEGWVYIFITFFVFLLDSLMILPNKNHLYFAVISFMILFASIISNGSMILNIPSFLNGLILLSVSILFLLQISASSRIRSFDDQGKCRLDSKRVRVSQLLVLITGLSIVLLGNYYGMMSMIPLWVAISGVFVYRLIIVTGKYLNL